jgi:hypothetical protein
VPFAGLWPDHRAGVAKLTQLRARYGLAVGRWLAASIDPVEPCTMRIGPSHRNAVH